MERMVAIVAIEHATFELPKRGAILHNFNVGAQRFF